MENATLNTGKKYIKDIFGSDQFYNIPEYQRPYVWGEDQIVALLEDVSKALENDSNKEYFLGCMIWNTRTEELSKNVHYEYQDILDGQQRFITLFLLHAVLRDISADPKLVDNAQKRLVQEANEYDNIPARNRVEFEIRDDKSFLDKYVIPTKSTHLLVNAFPRKEELEWSGSVRNMASGILVIHRWWREQGGDEETRQEFISSFYRYLSNKVLALYLATPNNLDDAYNLFTVLNSRGLQLQVSDILRAQNLRTIEPEELRKQYARKWSEFENAIGAPYKNFDDFLWAIVFIKMKYRSDDNKSLTKAFEFMAKRDMLHKGEHTFEYFGRYIRHFESITNGSISSRESGFFFQNLNFILSSVYGSAYLTPMMHFRERFGEVKIIDFLIRIDNLYSMAWLMGRRQGSTRTFVILRKIDHYFDQYSAGVMSQEEAANAMVTDRCLDYDYYDETVSLERPMHLSEFVQHLEQDKWGSFSGTKVNKTRYLLLKLDLLMGNINTILQYNKDSSSIEHLMPQKIEGTSWEIGTDFHKEWLHRLGNVVIIDRNKNAGLSNRGFSEKKERYSGAIETRANTNYVFLRNLVWDEEKIQSNHQRSVDLLRRYYEGNSLQAFLQIKKSLNEGQNVLF